MSVGLLEKIPEKILGSYHIGNYGSNSSVLDGSAIISHLVCNLYQNLWPSLVWLHENACDMSERGWQQWNSESLVVILCLERFLM